MSMLSWHAAFFLLSYGGCYVEAGFSNVKSIDQLDMLILRLILQIYCLNYGVFIVSF